METRSKRAMADRLDHDETARSSQPRRNQGRNQRMFASIQSALGGPPPSSASGGSGRGRGRRAKPEEPPVEQLDDLDSIISQISDMSIRSDRSAVQIKRNITASRHLAVMEEEEWSLLSESLLTTALDASETDFVVGLFVPLMEYDLFCSSFCSQLMSTCAAYILDGEEESGFGAVPALVGAILCANWPRNMSKAIDTVNPILYTTVSIVKGWLLVISEDNEPPTSEENGSDSEGEDGNPDREEPEVVNRCCTAVSSLCDSTQRSLWMKWPELCDEIYGSVKPAITHNSNVRGDVKSSLLHTLISLHMWTKTKTATTRSTITQTVFDL